jgi:hypothetical protein
VGALGLAIATAVSTAVAATTVSAAAAATATVVTGTRFVHGEVTAIEILAMESGDRGFAFGGAAHRDEPEAAGATAGAIHHNDGISDGAKALEGVLETVFGGVEGKISYVEFHFG